MNNAYFCYAPIEIDATGFQSREVALVVAHSRGSAKYIVSRQHRDWEYKLWGSRLVEKDVDAPIGIVKSEEGNALWVKADQVRI